MQPDCSLPHSQQPATCPYPEPYQSSTCPPSHVFKIHFNVILPSTPRSFPQVSLPKPYKQATKLPCVTRGLSLLFEYLLATSHVRTLCDPVYEVGHRLVRMCVSCVILCTHVRTLCDPVYEVGHRLVRMCVRCVILCTHVRTLCDPVYEVVGRCFKLLFEAKTTEDTEYALSGL
jgi:hypothetical protein